MIEKTKLASQITDVVLNARYDKKRPEIEPKTKDATEVKAEIEMKRELQEASKQF